MSENYSPEAGAIPQWPYTTVFLVRNKFLCHLSYIQLLEMLTFMDL